MKKLIFLLLSLIAMTVSVCMTESCERKSGHHDTYVDTTTVATMLEDFVNPEFKNGYEAYEFAHKLKTERYEDSVFLSLSEEVLCDICEVLNKTNERPTVSSIVAEYESGKRIYDTIHESPKQYSTHTAQRVTTNDSVYDDDGSKPLHTRDTTINGKRITIISYE